ncbi:DNA-binding PadR family transcriptional regulator [Amycolatopsis viridis]|uniref:DNA-binding PadR family transcriptional regulator n=2 Tax=Amycolatopsis viridis TaxID=185678 RepID=A0ABX0T2I7_9PSEU|nr:PadR family transcriptional regulator [Amycolatopsis viridis]NIH82124.1 DNA-binding PadR family transcriptional regulator [Amycolatopsis viridis]
MVVQQLVKAGFIAAQETRREGLRPERTTYALTPEGRAELRDWLRELVEEPRHEHPHFVVALSLIGALPPDDVVTLLHNRNRHLGEQRAEITELIESAKGCSNCHMNFSGLANRIATAISRSRRTRATGPAALDLRPRVPPVADPL